MSPEERVRITEAVASEVGRVIDKHNPPLEVVMTIGISTVVATCCQTPNPRETFEKLVELGRRDLEKHGAR